MIHDGLYAALIAAQAEMPAVAFDATNPFLKNKYASLGAIIRTAQPILAKHGLGFVQLVCTDEVGRIGLETKLVHESGDDISTKVYLPLNLDAKNVAQDAGGSITYLRRYSLAAMLGMYADEDTDGSKPQQAQPAQPKAEPKVDEPAPAKMGLATAMAVVSSDGKPYGEIETERLGFMRKALVKKLGMTDLPQAERETCEYKRDAIDVIVASRPK